MLYYTIVYYTHVELLITSLKKITLTFSCVINFVRFTLV
jgi:hypothetical protein